MTKPHRYGYAPVPLAGRGPALTGEGYALEEIEGGLYWVVDGFYQMIFIVTDEGTVAVDAPPSLGHNILRAITYYLAAPFKRLHI
jgi:hypothetical protein